MHLWLIIWFWLISKSNLMQMYFYFQYLIGFTFKSCLLGYKSYILLFKLKKYIKSYQLDFDFRITNCKIIRINWTRRGNKCRIIVTYQIIVYCHYSIIYRVSMIVAKNDDIESKRLIILKFLFLPDKRIIVWINYVISDKIAAD